MKILKTQYHVEELLGDKRARRDHEPSFTLEEARQRIIDLHKLEGKPDIMRAGSIAIDCGIVPASKYRIVEVSRVEIEREN